MSALSWQGTAQSGFTCDDPLTVTSMPFNDSGNTVNYGNNYTSTDVPATAPGAVTNGTGSTSYLNDNEVVYSYLAGADGSISINTTNANDWVALWVFTGCPFTSTVGYHTSTSGATRSIPNLPVIAGEVYYIVVSAWDLKTEYTIEITGTDVGDPPTCLKPTNIAASNLTVNSADVNWTEAGTASSWDVEYGQDGFARGDGTMVSGLTSSSYSIIGLDTSTAYDVYVRADCGAGDESFWSGPMSFRTLCDVVSNLPYLENFDTYGTGSAAFPACWGRPVTYTSSGTTWPSIVSRTGTSSAPNALKFQSAVGTPTYAVSPPYAEDIDNLRVQFMLKREGTSSGTIDVGVMSDATDISTFELVATINPSNNDFIEYVFDLDQVTLSGSGNFIALRHNSISASWYYWADDFHVGLVPTCPEPTALTVDSTTFNSSAEILWTAGDAETSWNISWGPSGYTPGDSSEIGTDTASVTNYEITGLGLDIYDVYVQANCGIGDLSYWTGPVTFTTGYCIPTGSSNNGDEIRNFTLANLDNDSATLEGTNGFSNYSNTVDPAELEAGETYVASLTSGGGSGNHGAAIWIDYDQNGVFDSTEMVAFVSNVIASTTVDFPAFTVPVSTADGTYRLRVQYHYNKTGDLLDPCLATSSFSETEDYSVVLGGGGGTFPSPYCDIADADDVSVEEITKVDFAGTVINNTDTTTVLIDKTDTVVDVMQAQTYNLKVEGNTFGNFENNIVAFIDWNQNGILDDVGEIYLLGTIENSTGSDGLFVTMDIEVPADAVLGETRIRITKTYTDEDSIAEVNPCAIEFDAFGYMIVPGYGQALDFTLNVEEADATDYSCDFAHVVVGDADGGAGSSVDSGFKGAVDLVVAAGQDFTLDTILVPFLTFAPEDAPITAQVVYYENAGGFPGTQIGSETVVPTILSSGEWVNPVAYEFKTQLDMTPFTFEGAYGIETIYWVQISMGTATNQETVFWAYTEGSGLEGAPMVQYSAADSAWSVPNATREGIYNFSGECIPLAPIGDCTGTPDGGVASVNPETGNANSTYTVSATGFSTENGLTYQWQSNTDGAGWIDEGTLENFYSAFTATAPADNGIEIEWRLEVTCTFSQESALSDVATFTTAAISIYCTPELDCTDGDVITNVTFQEIDNTTTCSANGYGDFTAMVATVQSGGTYPISVSVGNGFINESVSVWIDFDNNGTFEENEFFYIGTGSDEALTGNIAIPADAINGDYRMRVRVAAVGAGTATWIMSCDESQGYGETEDYTVTIDGLIGTDDFSSTNFTYYPNPMGDVLYIKANNDVESIAAYNVLGQHVLNNKNFADGKVDVSSLPAGTYLFRITFDSGQSENFTVLKK